MHSQEMTRLVSGLPHDEYLKESGRVQMAEMIYNLIDTLDQTERQLNEHRSKPGDTAERIRTQRDLTFAGSGYWNRIVRGSKD